MRRPPRIPAEAGYCVAAKLPRGPRGFALCRAGCGAECPTARNTFCSEACVHAWKLRTQPAYQARHVLERDKGVCERCSRDCLAVMAELRSVLAEHRRERWGDRARTMNPDFVHGFEAADGPFAKRCEDLGLPTHLRRLTRRLWEMDHRVPVAEGGGSCGLENLRTLCWACHRVVTAELARRRAEAKRAGKAVA